MALVPKSAVIQIRLDPDLLADFQRVCDGRHVTVSHQLRDWMYRDVADVQAREERKRLERLRAVPASVPAPESFQLEKTPPDPVKSLPVVKSKAKLKAERKRGL